MGSDLDLLYYINMYKKWWKSIRAVMIVVIFFTILFSLFMPCQYVSNFVIILTYSTNSNMPSLGGAGKLLGVSGIFSSTSYADIIIAMLKSDRMSEDINNNFGFRKTSKPVYNIETTLKKAVLIVDIEAKNPSLTKKIATFIIKNLDTMNQDLDITATKPMAKVLDHPKDGKRQSRKILQKMTVAGLLSFLLMSLYIFFLDYLKKIKEQ